MSILATVSVIYYKVKLVIYPYFSLATREFVNVIR